MLDGNLLLLLIIMFYLTRHHNWGLKVGTPCTKDEECSTKLCCFVGGSEAGEFVCSKEEGCDNLWCYSYKMDGLGDFDGLYSDQGVLQNGAPLYRNETGKILARLSTSKTSLALMNSDESVVYKQKGWSSIPDRVTFGGQKFVCQK